MANTDVDVYSRLSDMALPVAERNQVVTWDQVVAGDTEAEIPNPYRVLDNKDEYLNRALYVREAILKPAEESDNDAPYCILYCVSQDEMFILTDGGQGIYRYIADAVQKRLDQGRADATTGFFFPNGLRKSEYPIDADGKPIAKGDRTTKAKGKGVTYYFA